MTNCISGLPNLHITFLNGSTLTCENLDTTSIPHEKIWKIASDEDRVSPLISLHDSVCHGTAYLFTSRKLPKEKKIFLISELNRLIPEPFGINAFLTSGSTGLPKIIIHTNKNLIISAQKILKQFPNLMGKRFHHVFPTNYMAGLLNNLILPWISQSEILLDNEFNPISSLNLTRNSFIFSTEFAWLNPTMIKSLINASKYRKITFPKWNFIFSATGPLQSDIKKDFSKLFEIPIFNTYGSTEMLFISAENQSINFDSCGQPLDKVQIQLTDLREILVRTDTLAVYELIYNRELNIYELITNNSSLFTNTHDLGDFISESIILNSRSDDIVVLNGINYSLTEIEIFASNYPGIKHACASAKYGGTEKDLILFYEKENNKAIFSEEEFLDYLKTISTPILVPRKLISIKFPISNNGKIDKFKLRNMGL